MIIGIVTISYNQGSFLQQAIDSVLIDKPDSVDYCIVDPGSSDDSRDIITHNQLRFSSVVLSPDAGPADGLNKGFETLKRADIFGYINADDRFTPGALSHVCEYFAKNPSVDILLGSIHVIDGTGRRKARSRRVMKLSLSGYAEGTSTIWQQATFFRRSSFEAIGGFNPKNRTCWDSELIIDMLIAGKQVGYTRRALGEFRIHNASLTGAKNLKHQTLYLKDHERILHKIELAGCRQRPKLMRDVVKVLHKVNPLRHFSNLILSFSDALSLQ